MWCAVRAVDVEKRRPNSASRLCQLVLLDGGGNGAGDVESGGADLVAL
jgi:hypothetical protein